MAAAHGSMDNRNSRVCVDGNYIDIRYKDNGGKDDEGYNEDDTVLEMEEVKIMFMLTVLE